MQECFCFMFGALVGGLGTFYFFVACLKHPKGRASLLKEMHENYPVDYHATCHEIQFVIEDLKSK